jgi:hypothetical protein
MVYDSSRGKIVLFSGLPTASGQTPADLWELDPTTATWTNRTPSSLPAAWPQARYAASTIYDSTRGKLMLFSGLLTSGQTLADLWELDPTTAIWSNRTPPTLPADWPQARYAAPTSYDSSRGKIVLF